VVEHSVIPSDLAGPDEHSKLFFTLFNAFPSNSRNTPNSSTL
jgi:hypothetical protein